jgi:hypothetical protein
MGAHRGRAEGAGHHRSTCVPNVLRRHVSRVTPATARLTLVGLAAFVALTSVVCGIALAAGAHPLPHAWLEGSPLPDYTVLGLAMAAVVGGSALQAAALLRAGRPAGIFAAALAGLFLLGFEAAEVLLIDRNLGIWLLLVLPLQAVYTAIGLTLVGLATWLWRTRPGPQRQSSSPVDPR